MEFRSVDPGRNRNRRYAIAVQYRVDGGGELLITWGRVGARCRQRVESFDSLANLQRRYATLTARRRQHGYEQITEGASSSEAAPALTIDTTTRFTLMLQRDGYLGVFDSHRHFFVIRDVDPSMTEPGALQALAEQLSPDPESEGRNVDQPGQAVSRAA